MFPRTYLLYLLMLTPFLLPAQNKISVGFNFNQEINKLRITDSKAPEGISESGEVNYNYAVGIQIEYKVNEKLFLRSGAAYQHASYQHNIEVLGSNSNIFNGQGSRFENYISVTTIGIPIELGYRIASSNPKITFVVGAGGIINIPIDKKSNGVLYDPEESLAESENGFSTSLFTLGIFGGVEFRVSEHLYLGLEPNLRFTPQRFELYKYNSEAKSLIEVGYTARLRF